jgi:hypothetical protein
MPGPAVEEMSVATVIVDGVVTFPIVVSVSVADIVIIIVPRTRANWVRVVVVAGCWIYGSVMAVGLALVILALPVSKPEPYKDEDGAGEGDGNADCESTLG